MIGPEFQKAIYAALTGASVAGGRIYDRVPESATYPYITLGEEQVIDDGNACDDGWEVYATLHLWSRPVSGSKLEVKSLATSAATAIAAITSVTGKVLTDIRADGLRVISDPDGLTEHGILTIRALIDPA